MMRLSTNRVHKKGWVVVLTASFFFLSGCDVTAKDIKEIPHRILSLLSKQPTAVPPKSPKEKISTHTSSQEAGLLSITLTEAAKQRLGIRTEILKQGSYHDTRTVGGEVMIPPGKTIAMSAPFPGVVLAPQKGNIPQAGDRLKQKQNVLRLLMLPPEKDQLTAANTLKLAENRTAFAEQKLARAEQMLKEGAGSVRTKEEAQSELDNANTELRLAKALVNLINNQDYTAAIEEFPPLVMSAPITGRLLNLHVAPGQRVSAGATLFEIASEESLWIRVPVYAGVLNQMSRNQSVTVRRLAEPTHSPEIQAHPVAAPPSGNPQAASVDLFFELPRSQGRFQPGQKVVITLPMKSRRNGLILPRSAVLYDIHGGTWVYQDRGGNEYIRSRVELLTVEGDVAVLARGPSAGTRVVSTGAAELFGIEFGSGK